MKKNIFLILTFVLLSIPAHAQFKFGVTAGLNISKMHVSDGTYKDYFNKARPGFIVGPTVIYTIPKTGLGFDASALYDMRGSKSKSISDCKSVNCCSFQLPVNVRYGIDIPEITYWFVFTGPQFGVAVGTKDHYMLSGTGRTTGHAMERRWVDESDTFSWNFGIGGIFLEKVQVKISYNLNLRKTGEFQQVDLETGSKRTLATGKLNALQISLSYLF